MEYRNDLEAARLRLETLEAKLDEREASLRAREAEIAELRAERDRLRARDEKGGDRPSFARRFIVPVLTHLVVAGLAASVFLHLDDDTDTPPAPVMVPAIEENGPLAEGHVVPEPPPPTYRHTENTGRASDDTPSADAHHTENTGRASDAEPISESPFATAQDRVYPHVRACQRKEVSINKDAHGIVAVVFDIDPAGKVTKVTLEPLTKVVEPWWGKTFESCVVAAYQKLSFPKTSDGAKKTTMKHAYYLQELDPKNDLGF